jgi:hypothetical protein
LNNAISDGSPTQIGSIWGMPSSDMVVSTLVGLYFIQYFSKGLGLVLIFAVGYSRVVLGKKKTVSRNFVDEIILVDKCLQVLTAWDKFLRD